MPAALETLKKRKDFLACARARRWSAPGFVLQARRRGEDDPSGPIRVGYTCSKKLGNAVTRNRAKRRLRAVVADRLGDLANPGWDYVLIGRPGNTVARAYPALLQDLEQAIAKVHAPRKPKTRA